MTIIPTDISEADFEQIKQAFIAYLQTKPEFTDYNFSGSAFGILMDILAYNTHYNAMHSNLVFSEQFLDTASKRGSIVSAAKELNYLPRSKTATGAQVNLAFTVTGNPQEYVLPRGTQFTTSIGSKSYIFVTSQDILINKDEDDMFIKTIDIYQGQYTTYDYTVNLNDSSQRFVVPSYDVDTRFLTVMVKDTIGSTTWNEYQNFNDVGIGGVGPDETIFFLTEQYDNYYECHFGDGTIAKSLVTGNVVRLSYLITSGEDVNGARTFALVSPLPNGANAPTITTVSSAVGGKDRESAESIKFLAPYYYAAQDRAVTTEDYVVLLKTNYPIVKDASVWSGDENPIPYYGKTFVSIVPEQGQFLTTSMKEYISTDFRRRFSGVTGRIEIVDPEYTYVIVNATITYNARKLTGTSPSGLEDQVKDTIEAFFDENANKFNEPIYYSALVNAIDDTSDVIKNSITDITLEKRLRITAGTATRYAYEFNNALAPNSIRSNEFISNGQTWKVKDVPQGTSPFETGTLVIYRVSGDTTTYLSQNAGTVNYQTGEIVLTNVRVDNIPSDPIQLNLVFRAAQGQTVDSTDPEKVVSNYNIYTNQRNQLIVLKPDSVTVTMIPDNA